MTGRDRSGTSFEPRVPWSGVERRRSSRPKQRRVLALGAGFTLLLIGLLLSASARKDLLEASAQVERSRETLSSIDALSHHLTDAEAALAAQSGGSHRPVTVRTGQAMAAATEELARLASSVEDDASQRARCKALGSLFESIRTAQGAADLEKASSAIGTARSWLHAISDRERNRLSGWPAEASHLNFRLDGAVAFTGLVAVLLLASSLFWLRREDSYRQRAQDALADSVARLQGILDAATEVAIVATDGDGVVTLFNSGAERMLGFTASELVGLETPGRFLLRRELADRARAISFELGIPVQAFDVLVAKARRGLPDEREWTFVAKDGSTIPVILAVTPLLDAKGTLSGFLGIARNITAQKQAEKLKREFISTVSHELRTPLTSIRGSLGLLAAGRAGELPPRALPLVEIAHRNAERLVLIVNDILDVEKMEAGEMRFAMQPLDTGPLVEQAIAANHSYALEHGVDLEARPAPEPAKVRGDADRLIQVLTNLLSNAAKYSPEGGSVEVSTTVTPDRVTIEVRDHGPGIPEEFQSRLFQKFAQADGTDSKRRGGTGLGLAISKAIVEAHGGRLGFETAPGWGTAFRVELPRHRDSSGLTVTGISGRGVLICEDDRDVASLLALLLERNGIGAQVASTAGEARELLTRNHYSAMTLDIHLPGESGSELFRWVRSRPATARLPIVVVSGTDASEMATLESGHAGIVAWLEKPIDEEKLLSAVRAAMKGSAGRRPRVLHVEDDADVAALVQTMLGDLVDVVEARTLARASELLANQDFDLVVLDVDLPDGSGLELLAAGDKRVRPAPVIVYSAGDVDASVRSETLAVLVKGRTTNEQLAEKILESLRPLIDTKEPASRSPGQEEEA